MAWIVFAALLVFGMYLWKRNQSRKSAQGFFDKMTERTLSSRTGRVEAGPDLAFAAKGYAQVAVTRRNAPHLELHTLERGFAEGLLNEGCTREQALSARWGGSYAIADDLGMFDDALVAYKETRAEAGRVGFQTKEDASQAYYSAALMVMSLVHTMEPREYGRFLKHINA